MCVWGHELISQLVNTNYAKDLYVTYLDDFAAFFVCEKSVLWCTCVNIEVSCVV